MATATSIASSPYASASLYVGDLSRDVTEAMLFEIFNAVGPVASVRICRDAATRRSLGYAYVNFHRLEDAERALDTMNFKLIRGRQCRIMWSHRDPSLRKSGVGNVFVNHLEKSINNKQLYDTFSICGNILSCKVVTNLKGESLGYGFVHYASAESANKAIQTVNGKVINKVQVYVTEFKPKNLRNRDPTNFTNLYIKNLPANVDEDRLRGLFSKFGNIVSHKLQRDEDGKSRGVGFVAFQTTDEAKRAIATMHEHKVGDKILYVVPFQSKLERERHLQNVWEQRKADRQRKFQGVNLFIKNLADSFDDKRLADEFSKFGNIKSAKVMLDERKKSKGFGFVNFETPEEATKALQEMNGRMLEGKPLYVALFQDKETRRQQLEAQYAARVASYGGPPVYPGPQGTQLFYPGMHQQRQLMYPGMPMVTGRWNPGPQGTAGHQMMGMPGHQGINYSLMPAVGRGTGAPPRGRGRGRGGAPPSAPGTQMRQHQPPGTNVFDQQRRVPDVAPAAVRYSSQTRNPPGQPQTVATQTSAAQRPVQPPQARTAQPVAPPKPAVTATAAAVVPTPVVAGSSQPPLTIQQLAQAPESARKQMIGERLFPLVHAQHPTLAGKITGMLLEMDNGELIMLLESREALSQKIKEALVVLEQAQEEEDEEEAEEEEEEEI